jgi:hypothetical protein
MVLMFKLLLINIVFIYAILFKEQLIADEELDVDITSAILVGFKENVASPDVVKSVCLAVTALVNWNGKKISHFKILFKVFFFYLQRNAHLDFFICQK